MRRWAAVAIVGYLASFSVVMAIGQDAQTQPQPADAPTPQVSGKLETLDDLIQSSMEALTADVGEDSSGAALAVARAYFADLDVDTQSLGIPHLIRAAELGSEEALILLGGVYQRGAYGVPADRSAAISQYEAAIEQGSVDAKLALAKLLLATDFTEEGQQRSLGLLIEAADNGRLEAANLLGTSFALGRGTTADVDQAMRFFGMGILAGDRATFVSVGDLLRTGIPGLSANPALALQLFERAGELGDTSAKRRVADMHLRGETGSSEVQVAVGMLNELGQSGDTTAYLTLGDLFAQGEFVPADIEKALEYYQKAADQGNVFGIVRLGDSYISGLPGMQPDTSKGINYYEEAAALGNTSAMRALANLYLGGTLVRPDPVRAVELLSEASGMGDGGAAETMAVLYASNDPFSADYKVVRAYLDTALAAGNVRAAFRVASAIAQGPLARDHGEEAFNILSNAVTTGVPGAAAELARLQLAGAFPAQSLAGVISMLNDASQAGDVDSARFLFRLYRDGSGLVLPPDPAAAEAFLASIEPILGTEAAAFERISLLASRGDDIETLRTISAEFSKLRGDNGLRAIDNLRRANARAYVYILQERLAQRDLYSGAVNGTLDGQTIRAFNAVCAAAQAERECAPGPMTAGAGLVLGRKVLEPQT